MAKAPSVISRVIAILNSFSEHKAFVSIEELAELLDISVASAYRYASDLTEAGLLSRASGRYRLGPKIIELEYLIQSYDPVLKAGRELMDGLAEFTGCNVLLCNVYDDTLVNVLHVTGRNPIQITYTKGMRMPLFRGAQAHIVLAYMNRRKLKRLYETALADTTLATDALAIGADWRAFSKQLRDIRIDGYYISENQLDEGVTGIAAPVLGENQEIIGSLVLIVDGNNPSRMANKRLAGLVKESAQEISKRVERISI